MAIKKPEQIRLFLWLLLRRFFCRVCAQPVAVRLPVQPQTFGNDGAILDPHAEACRHLRAAAIATPAQGVVNAGGIVFRQVEAGEGDVNADFFARFGARRDFQANALSCGSRLKRVMWARPVGSAPRTA